MMRLTTGRNIPIYLVERGTSGYDNAAQLHAGRIVFNVGHYGYERAVGHNTFVDRSGMRTLAHEVVHASLRHNTKGGVFNERVASQKTNVIRKQHFIRIGFPELFGQGNRYDFGVSPPRGATIKEYSSYNSYFMRN